MIGVKLLVEMRKVKQVTSKAKSKLRKGKVFFASVTVILHVGTSNGQITTGNYPATWPLFITNGELNWTQQTIRSYSSTSKSTDYVAQTESGEGVRNGAEQRGLWLSRRRLMGKKASPVPRWH